LNRRFAKQQLKEQLEEQAAALAAPAEQQAMPEQLASSVAGLITRADGETTAWSWMRKASARDSTWPGCSPEAHRKRHLQHVPEATPTKKTRQPIAVDLAAATEAEGPPAEEVPVCDHRMLICRQGYSLIEDFSYIPECPDCGQLIHVGHRGFCPTECNCGDYLAAYPPDSRHDY